jgi:hypothetical protein
MLVRTVDFRVSGCVERVVGDVRMLRGPRSALLHEARAARTRARSLRRRALAARESLLEERWRLWSAGIVAEPPSLVPESWRCEQDLESLLDEAMLLCLECRDAALRVGPLPLVAALSDVTARHLLERSTGYHFLLSATARLTDELESKLDSTDADAVVCASAMRRTRDACRAALLAALC